MIIYLCIIWIVNVSLRNISPTLVFSYFFFLLEGTTELELNNIETQIDCRLPDDYRCSYRIHNGQKLVIPGSVSIWRYLPGPTRLSASNNLLPGFVSSGWWAACRCQITTAQRCCWTWRQLLEASSRGRGWDTAFRSPSASTLASASTWPWIPLRDATCSRASTPVLYVALLPVCGFLCCLIIFFKVLHPT